MRQVVAEQLPLFDLGPNMADIRREASLLKHCTSAPLTHKAYSSDWRGFQQWCSSTGRESLPASDETLALYITAQLSAGKKVTSVGRYIAAISARHRAENLPLPDRSEARAIVRGAQRQRKEQPKKRTALMPTILRKICLLQIADGGPNAIRDRAFMLLGIATALRRSNISGLDLEDIKYLPGKGFAVTIRSSKTDQDGRGKVLAMRMGHYPETCPVRALKQWLALRGQRPGPLFCKVEHNDAISTHRRLRPGSISELLKKWVERSGTDARDYGAHSLRAGFATIAHLEGASITAIMETTGHKSVAMVHEYLRNTDPFAGANPLGRAL